MHYPDGESGRCSLREAPICTTRRKADPLITDYTTRLSNGQARRRRRLRARRAQLPCNCRRLRRRCSRTNGLRQSSFLPTTVLRLPLCVKFTACCVSVATTLHRAALPEADLRDLLPECRMHLRHLSFATVLLRVHCCLDRIGHLFDAIIERIASTPMKGRRRLVRGEEHCHRARRDRCVQSPLPFPVIV